MKANLALEAMLIAVVSGLSAFFWSLVPDGRLAPVFGIFLFAAVVWIHFFYDDRPKGIFREDLALLIMSFVAELALLIVSAMGTIAIAGILLSLYAIFGIPLPAMTNVLLSFWIGLNLVLYWHERKIPQTA